MLDILHREFVCLWYYFELQLRQILPYWVLGMVIGSVISVFCKGPFTGCSAPSRAKSWGRWG